MVYVADSWLLVELARDNKQVLDRLADRLQKSAVRIPGVCLWDFARLLSKERGMDYVRNQFNQFRDGYGLKSYGSLLIDWGLKPEIILEAASIARKFPEGRTDCIVLASAQHFKATIITGDNLMVKAAKSLKIDVQDWSSLKA